MANVAVVVRQVRVLSLEHAGIGHLGVGAKTP